MNDFTKLAVDLYYNRVEQFSKNDASRALKKKFSDVLGVPEDCTGKDLRRAINRHKHDIFELIEDTIDEMLVSGWGDNPFFNEFVDSRNIALGDRNEFYVPDNSVLTVSEFSGNHHDLIRQKLAPGQSFQVKTRWYGVKIYEEFEHYYTNRIDWAAFINKMYEAFDNKINTLLYGAFMNIDSALPAGYAETGTLTLQKAVDLAEKVRTGTGHDVTIAGTRSAISALMALTPSGWISEDMKNQRNTTGLVTYFEGIRTMVVPQVFTYGTRNFALDNKKLIFLPETDNKFIKLVNEGDSQYYESTDPATNLDMTVEAEYMAKLGVATVVGVDFGTYKFS